MLMAMTALRVNEWVRYWVKVLVVHSKYSVQNIYLKGQKKKKRMGEQLGTKGYLNNPFKLKCMKWKHYSFKREMR